MPLILRRSRDLPEPGGWDAWCPVAGARPALPPDRKLADLAPALESAFAAIRDDWRSFGRELQAGPSAAFAHMPGAAADPSDFGVMLAWVKVADGLAAEARRILAVCDDPWLFRALAGRPGVEAGAPPPLRLREAGLALRGAASRARVALQSARTSFGRRWNVPQGGAALLVYGHPASDAQGHDAYFGDLMRRFPELRRAVHVDCPLAAAGRLEADGRTASLHRFGDPVTALSLAATRWRPKSDDWLVRRAACLEGSGGGAAMMHWQTACQERWLDAARPEAVAWPWENHPWERALVRAARARGIATVGYQHTVVGPHQYNQSPHANRDGLASIPDTILCSGPAARDELAADGVPADRLAVAGAFRIAPPRPGLYDPRGPVFVALPYDAALAAALVAALSDCAGDRRILVRPHPMYPHAFPESESIRRADGPLDRQDRVSLVIYATGTVGLEAMLGGLPTVRFVPEDGFAIDVLPRGVPDERVGPATLRQALDRPPAPPVLARDRILAPVGDAVWARALRLAVPVSDAAPRRARVAG